MKLTLSICCLFLSSLIFGQVNPPCIANSFFQETVGGIRRDDCSAAVLSADNGYVMVGQTNSFGNGGVDGLIIKVDKNGNLVWSKAVGGANEDYFQIIKKTSDDGFIVSGQTKSFGNAAGDGWLTKFDASGNVTWSKKYGDGNVYGDVANDVIQLSDGGFAFTGTHKFSPGQSESFVVRTDNLGNVIWSKFYGNPGSDEAWGILEDGNYLIVSGLYQASSYYDGYVMKLDKATGTMQWIKGYDAENRSNRNARIQKTNIGYQMLTVVADDFQDLNQQVVVWNLNVDGTVQNIRKTVIPGPKTISAGWCPLPDGGFMVGNGESNNSSDIILAKVNATGTLAWSKKFLIPGRQHVNANGLVRSADGGWTIAGVNNNSPTVVADSNDIYLIAVDSMGNAETCSGVNTTDLTVVTPTYSLPTPNVIALGNVTITNPVITVGVVNTLLSTTMNTRCYDCQDVLPGNSPCSNNSGLFQKTYGGNKEDDGYSAALAADSGYVMVGLTNSFGNGGFDGLVIKVGKTGNTVWSKAVGGTADDYFYSIKKTSDNGFIICGQTKSYGHPAGDAWLVKLDAGGNMQWSKKYGDGNAYGDVGFDAIQLADGGYAFCGVHQFSPGMSQTFIVRTDNQGNVLWNKYYGNSGSDEAWNIMEDGNDLVVAGFYQASSYYDGYVMKLDKATGVIQWIKGYDAENRSSRNARLGKTNSGYQMMTYLLDDFSDTNQQLVVWNLNTDGTVQNIRKTVIPGIKSISMGWRNLPDGGFVVANGVATNTSDIILARVNPNGSLAWSKKFVISGKQSTGHIIATPENGWAIIGTNNNSPSALADSSNFLLMTVDSVGDAGSCSGTPTNDLTVVTPAYSLPTPDVVYLGTVTINNLVVNPGIATVTPTMVSICGVSGFNFDFNYQLNICNPLTVQFNAAGTDTIAPYWSFGDGGVATGTLNPSHTFPAFGNYLIKYSVSNGTCRDTISKMVNISITNADIILTHDTTICYGATKQLTTAPSLSFCWNPTTYLNNPNSPNPITSTPQNITYYFTAQVEGTNVITNGNFSQGNTGFTSQYNYATPNVTEGQYYVGTNPQAWNPSLSPCTDHTTGSGNMMLVNGAPTPNVNVWTQTVTVTPNTNYAFSTWVQALWPPNPAQLKFSINGNQIGTTITAALPTCTWTQFYTTWNSGSSTSATISIVNINTAVQGNDFALDDISFAPVLIKRDSVIITVERPVVTTNPDTAFCQGVQLQLNSTGANSYSWTPPAGLSNPNIGNPVASTATTTQYIVTGTTTNGCVAKDTVMLTVVPSPVVSTSNDTTICKNGSAQLFASGGTGYSWTPTTALNNPNIPNPIATPTANTLYKVIVSNANNCATADSVTVNVYPDPVFTISPAGSICRNDSLQLVASGGNVYSWQPSSDITNPNIANPKVFPQNTTTYTVQITETNCNNSSTLSTTVTVFDLPDVKAFKSNDIDCSSEFSQLTATGGVSYIWSPAASLNNPNIANPIATPTVQTVYTVRGKDANNCVNYDTITVDITSFNKGSYLMPSAFTPNNDGLNDCYGIKYWGVIDEIDFSIYNRWGEKVFHTKNPNGCWDGTYKGEKQDSNVFVYLIKAKTNCGEVTRKGTFVLIR